MSPSPPARSSRRHQGASCHRRVCHRGVYDLLLWLAPAVLLGHTDRPQPAAVKLRLAPPAEALPDLRGTGRGCQHEDRVGLGGDGVASTTRSVGPSADDELPRAGALELFARCPASPASALMLGPASASMLGPASASMLGAAALGFFTGGAAAAGAAPPSADDVAPTDTQSHPPAGFLNLFTGRANPAGGGAGGGGGGGGAPPPCPSGAAPPSADDVAPPARVLARVLGFFQG